MTNTRRLTIRTAAGSTLAAFTLLTGAGQADTAAKSNFTVFGRMGHIKELSGHSFVSRETLFRDGKVIGHDHFHCGHLNNPRKIRCFGVFRLPGGSIFAQQKVGNNAKPGTVTGGKGAYKNTSGTIEFAGTKNERSVAYTFHLK